MRSLLFVPGTRISTTWWQVQRTNKKYAALLRWAFPCMFNVCKYVVGDYEYSKRRWNVYMGVNTIFLCEELIIGLRLIVKKPSRVGCVLSQLRTGLCIKESRDKDVSRTSIQNQLPPRVADDFTSVSIEN